MFKYTLTFERIPTALDSLRAKLLMWGSKDKELSKIRPKYFDMLKGGRLETNGDEIKDELVLWPRLFGCINIKFDFDKLRVSLLAIIHLSSEVISVVIFLWRSFIFLSSTIKQVSSANSLILVHCLLAYTAKHTRCSCLYLATSALSADQKSKQ